MSRRLLIAVWLAIVVATVIAYLPSLRGGFIWDDDAHVTHNRMLHSIDGLRRIWVEPGAVPQYYPLAHTGFWVQYQLFGDRPAGYKAVNLALHLTSSGLVMLILLRLGLPAGAASLAAAVFALHPVHVESVAWITELKNTLSGAFYLAAALAYLCWRFPDPARPAPNPRGYWIALVLFVAALLSKTVTASWPAAMLLIVWWKAGRVRWSDVKPLLPFFVLGVVLGLGTVLFERHFVGAKGEDFGFTLADRQLIAGRAAWFYAAKLVWPHPIVFTYRRWAIDAGVWWQWLFPAAAIGLLAGLWRWRGRVGIGPLVAVLFFGGTLVPALGFIDVYPFVFSFVADHFQYLASLGLIVLAAAVAERWRQRVPAVAAVSLVALAALGAKTFAQGFVYRDVQTLYRHVLQHNPDSWMAHNNLGGLLIREHRYADARPHIERALQLHERNAGAMRNLATILAAEGRAEEARAWREKAYAIQPEDTLATIALGEQYLKAGDTARARVLFEDAAAREPRNLLAWYQLGMLSLREGDPAAAVDHLRRATDAQGDLAEPHYQLAQALMATGDAREAARHFAKAQAISPEVAETALGLGNALAAVGDLPGSIEQFRRSIELKPAMAEAHCNLGIVLAMSGNVDQAVSSLQRAVELDPKFADAHFQLATLFAQISRLDEAATHYEAAIASRPDFAEAYNNLGVVRNAQGRTEDAVQAHRRALTLRPDYSDARLNLGIALVGLELYEEACDVLAPLSAKPEVAFAAAYQHGLALVALERREDAAAVLAKAVQRDPSHVDAALLLAEVQLQRGRHAEARQLFTRVVRVNPDSAVALRSLAWLIATDPELDPAADAPAMLEAIKLADRAHRLTGGDDPRSLDVLAAAHAAAGHFTDAVRYGQIAHELAVDRGDVVLAAAVADRVEAYRQGRRPLR